MSPLAGALIAGGASRRFGQDKARLAWGQGSLAGHLLREMQKAGLRPLVFNAAQGLEDLPEGVQVLPDALPGQGPLGGLATVLRAAAGPVLVAACDMPGLNAGAFAALARAWQPGMQGLVAQGPDGWQPLFGIYSPSLLPDIEARLSRGQRALHRLIEDQALSPWGEALSSWLVNINSPEDWQAWKVRPAE